GTGRKVTQTMKSLTIAVLLLLPVFASAQTSKPQSKHAPVKSEAKLEIPAEAVPAADGSYRYTGPDGKQWIYRKTPFGVSRTEDKPAEPKPAPTLDGVKATEDGDSIRFERPGPFGVYKWQRKKTELNESEKAAWDREKARAAPKQD